MRRFIGHLHSIPIGGCVFIELGEHSHITASKENGLESAVLWFYFRYWIDYSIECRFSNVRGGTRRKLIWTFPVGFWVFILWGSSPVVYRSLATSESEIESTKGDCFHFWIDAWLGSWLTFVVFEGTVSQLYFSFSFALSPIIPYINKFQKFPLRSAFIHLKCQFIFAPKFLQMTSFYPGFLPSPSYQRIGVIPGRSADFFSLLPGKKNSWMYFERIWLPCGKIPSISVVYLVHSSYLYTSSFFCSIEPSKEWPMSMFSLLTVHIRC